jgi:hypothetical protein
MSKPTVLVVGSQTLNFVMGEKKSKSATDYELLKEWLEILQIDTHVTVNVRDLEAIRNWKGPILALGQQARKVAWACRRKKQTIHLPHPHPNLRHPYSYHEVKIAAQKLAPLMVIEKPKVVVVK